MLSLRTVFYTPVVGNVLGKVLSIMYRATKSCITTLNVKCGSVPVTIYTVTSFFMMRTIMGQAAGQYVFVRSDIKEDTPDWKRIVTHELKHVEQQYRFGWFGILFFIKYYWQFFAYTLANMGVMALALKQMPLEREAYATDVPQTTSNT